MRLTGKVVVVTGAAGGIGRAVCAAALAEGAKVLATDRAFGAESLSSDGGDRLTECEVDLTDPNSGATIVGRAVEAFGAVDILVANAGQAADYDFESVADEVCREEIEVNLLANFRLVRATLPYLRARGGGSIIAISSVNAHAYFGCEAYSAAKAGLESFVRSLAVRYGPDGIRANALVLGTIGTPAWQDRLARDPGMFERLNSLFPLRRIGRPQDVARLVTFVVSEEASWMTGSSVVLDGGLSVAAAGFTSAVFGE